MQREEKTGRAVKITLEIEGYLHDDRVVAAIDILRAAVEGVGRYRTNVKEETGEWLRVDEWKIEGGR